jgi:hypothetical protein
MQKTLRIVSSLLLALFMVLASIVIIANSDDNFFEGFENGSIPSDWSIVNNGDNKYGATWEIIHGYEYAHSGYYAVACSPGDQYEYQDEWLIFNASSLNVSKYEKPFLMFWHKAGFAFKDNKPNQLLISNTTKNINDFKVITTFYYPDGTLRFDWTRVKVDLQDYKNDSSLYIAWRYRSINGEIWRLDDVYIGEYFDDTPPTISDVKIEPNVQVIGGYVNISCNVTDDTLNGLDKVVINITYPNGSYHEEDMLLSGLSAYYYNHTYNLDGTYSFYIEATDKYNNSEETNPLEFTILRSFNVSILPSTTINENSNFTVQVKDSLSGDPIENATILFDDNQNTTDASGNASFIAPEVDLDTNYTIIVSKEGYANYSTNITVKNVDNLPPQILDIKAEPLVQLVNNSVNISCRVIDDVSVDNVKVRIYGPPGFAFINATMNASTEGRYYYNTTYNITGEYNYSIWAQDSSGNTNFSENKSFHILLEYDTTPPTISDVNVSPKNQALDKSVNISCLVTDNVAVDTVLLNLTYPDGSRDLFTMLSASGGKYYLNNSYPAIGLYNFTIHAVDTSGNENESPVYNFTIFFNMPPEIKNITIVPPFRINHGWINISCTVLDDQGVDAVRINITKPNGTYYIRNMSLSDEAVYYYNDTYNVNGTYLFYIYAEDIYGLGNKSDVFNFTIGDEEAPHSSLIPLSDYWYKSDHMNIWANARDYGYSGVKNITLYYRYSPDNKTWGSWVKYSTIENPPWKWSFNTSNGTGYYQFYCVAVDAAGNRENKTGKEIELGFDNIPPIATVNEIIPYFHSTSFKITATVLKNDELSGISEVDLFYRWSENNASWGGWEWYERDSDGRDGWSWNFDTTRAEVRDGYYQFYAKARDKADNNETNETIRNAEAYCMIDSNGPEVSIERPKEGYLYINDEEIRKTFFGKTIIIGKITINADAFDSFSTVSKVEFWLDDELEYTDSEAPYTYTLQERKFGRHEIVIVAYDEYGNKNSATLNVLMFSFKKGSSYSNEEILKLINNNDVQDTQKTSLQNKMHLEIAEAHRLKSYKVSVYSTK